MIIDSNDYDSNDNNDDYKDNDDGGDDYNFDDHCGDNYDDDDNHCNFSITDYYRY